LKRKRKIEHYVEKNTIVKLKRKNIAFHFFFSLSLSFSFEFFFLPFFLSPYLGNGKNCRLT